jgi:hypothetical protein
LDLGQLLSALRMLWVDRMGTYGRVRANRHQ